MKGTANHMTPKYRVALYREDLGAWVPVTIEEFESGTNVAHIIEDVKTVKERNRPAIDKKVKRNESP